MSFNQSRSDKSETQYRKSGRSASYNQQRGSSVSYGRGAGAGPAPSPSSSLSSNRSFNKKPINAQGGQSRVSVPTPSPPESSGNAPVVARNIQNGSHVQPQLHGASDAPVAGTAAKPTDSSNAQRNIRAVPKAPTSQPAAVSADGPAPTTPAKSAGDASKGFAFQFGSNSPVYVNVMQIPARTSSAPPNLDEQKRDQARHESFRPVPNLPTPSGPKQQLQRKDVDAAGQSNAGEAQPVPKSKKETQVPPTLPASQTQKPSVIPIPMTSVQMPFHQPQVQFGAPNPPIQSQGVTGTSLQMAVPMPLMGNAPQVQQQVFLQPHPMPPQGMMHQGQGLSFTTQMGPQLPPQLGNIGLGINPQFAQQQGGKFGGPRKTPPVRITHPDTHEELRLDKRTDTHSDGGSSGPRSHPNLPPQTQPVPSFPSSHAMNYYSNSYSPNPLYFSATTSLPLTSGQLASNSQAPRFNYPVSQGPQNVPFINQSTLGSHPVHKTAMPVHGVMEQPNFEHVRDGHGVISFALSGTGQVTVKQAAGSTGEKVVDSSSSNSCATVEKSGSLKTLMPHVDTGSSQSQKDSKTSSESSLPPTKNVSEPLVSKSLPGSTKQSAGLSAAVSVESQQSVASPSPSAGSEEPQPGLTVTEGRRKETLSRSNSLKEHQKKPGKKGHSPPQNQVGGQSISTSSLASQASEPEISTNAGVSETLEAKITVIPSAVQEGLSEVSGPGASQSNVDSDISNARVIVSDSDSIDLARPDYSAPTEVQEARTSPEGLKQDNSFEACRELTASKSQELDVHTKQESILEETIISNEVPTIGNEVPSLESVQGAMEEPVSCHTAVDRISNNLDVTTSRAGDSTYAYGSHGDKTSNLDLSVSRSEAMGGNEVPSMKSGLIEQQSIHVPATDLSEATAEQDVEGVENVGVSAANILGSKDKPTVELNRTKSTLKKKKMKELLQKKDAEGTTSDLYMAYKGPDEKKKIVVTSESTTAPATSEQAPTEASLVDGVVGEKSVQNKAELDDWEDAADISTPKLETTNIEDRVITGLVHHDKNENGSIAKKYSRDFLLKFAEHCIELPVGFEITTDLAAALMSASANVSHRVDRDSHPSPGRANDRTAGVSRIDRRGGGTVVDDDHWNKVPGPFGSGNMRLDLSYVANASFRPGQASNFGVLRNPRAQTPPQYVGGILSGPMQPMGPQGGLQRNNSDADRWQRATNFQQKGLIPSPQTPLQMMHKAEKKYEVGKVAGEEQAKQRQLKAILNKLTPQNFEKLFEQVKAVKIDNAVTLTGVISQIFDKALMEPTFCEMYANFCFHLAGDLPDFTENNEKITFKRLLLNKCQEEFERGEREEKEANQADEGEVNLSEQKREEKRVKARRRMLGNIRLIGELYKKRMLTERIMHECIQKLLGQYQNPDEEDVEALCKLMSTIGEMIDHPKAKEHMDAYFERMVMLSNNMKLSSRVRFMLKDAIELRSNKWQQRRKIEGPKKIEEVHRDAAQERQAQVSRLTRNSSMNPSPRRAPMDFNSRGPMLSSPNTQMGSFRGVPPQVRGYTQDARFEERHTYDPRTISVPLPQRPIGDDSITLGPQGGLARGMSIRGPQTMSAVADIPPGPGDSRRVTAGLNGFSSVSDRTTYSPREDLVPRHMPDRYAGPAAYEQLNTQDRNMVYANRDPRNLDRSFDRPLASSPPSRGQGPTLNQNVPPEKVFSEERLRDMSLAAIKEFYSARDEKEVALCIKDLNSPSFHPSMISLWVTDSFERKEKERNLLASLLINLTRSQDGVLSQPQLIKGFEGVLTTLEDAVNDAPKAPEFLGGIFAKVILENVIPLGEIGRLLHEGGEEPGSLLEFGLAGDVLGSTLESIKLEKGEGILNEIRSSSSLRLEDFRSPDPYRSRILEKFI